MVSHSTAVHKATLSLGCDQTLSPPNTERWLAESPLSFRRSFGKRVVGRDLRARRFGPTMLAERPEVVPYHTFPEISESDPRRTQTPQTIRRMRRVPKPRCPRSTPCRGVGGSPAMVPAEPPEVTQITRAASEGLSIPIAPRQGRVGRQCRSQQCRPDRPWHDRVRAGRDVRYRRGPA